jgi:hypothetical protein
LILLLQFKIKLCQNLPSEVKYSREAASFKMVISSVVEKNLIQSKFKISAKWPCPAVLIYVRLWSKYLIIEMAKLKLFQRQLCTTIIKQREDYMAIYKQQQQDDMAIHRWQLYHTTW